jgi:hypothetical protein
LTTTRRCSSEVKAIVVERVGAALPFDTARTKAIADADIANSILLLAAGLRKSRAEV